MNVEDINNQFKGLIDQYPWALMLLVCIGIGAAIKKANFNKLPANRIPIIMSLFGMIFYPAWLFFQQADYRYNLIFGNAAVGAFLGLASTGAHQLIKENKDLISKIPVIGLLIKVIPSNGDTEIQTKPAESKNTV